MLTERINDLMHMPLAELKALPRSGSYETVDDNGHRIQMVTWCDRLTDDKYRVVVSLHRMRLLGVSSVIAAEGFTIDEAGNVETIDPSVALALLS